MRRSIYLSILLCLFGYMGAQAQVTIDKDEVLSDSISVVYDYDILENLPIDSITAYKGAGMPRVRLFDPLKLQLGAGVDFTKQGKDHVGLTVYNVADSGKLCPGFHTWDGQKWLPEREITRPDLVVVDKDGNTYKAKWFGRNVCKGAYWTTSNMYTTTTSAGKPFSSSPLVNPAYAFGLDKEIRINADNLDPKTTITYGDNKAAGGAANNVSKSVKEYIKEFGLLYSWSQAYEACPNGWRLPNDAEWTELIKTHGKPQRAAAGMRKNNNYYTSTDGQQMKWGRVDPEDTVLSGFDAVPAGNIYYDDACYSYYWGTLTAWWSSTPGISAHIRFDQNKVMISRGFNDFYLSVRCVKASMDERVFE